MRGAANFAWANRQGITHFLRGAFKRIFGDSTALDLIYDVCHNIAKHERHEVEGKKRDVLVHRKGATRAFPPGHPEVNCRLPSRRPAGVHSRQHGHGLVGARGAAGFDAGDLRHHLPRRRASAEPRRRQEGPRPQSVMKASKMPGSTSAAKPKKAFWRKFPKPTKMWMKSSRWSTMRASPGRWRGCGRWG